MRNAQVLLFSVFRASSRLMMPTNPLRTLSWSRMLVLLALAISLTVALPLSASAAAVRSGFDTVDLPANDDGSTGPVLIGFTLDFFGASYSELYVNNNGNVTFNGPLATFTPFTLTPSGGFVIIAPFFADVDTRVGNIVQYGQGLVDGRPAFEVTWPGVGCYNQITSVLNIFQVVLIKRFDTGSGNFDIEFNYDQIQWETGTASGGSPACLGGISAHVGYSNGVDTAFELPGSGVPGSFLDSNGSSGLKYNSLNSAEPGRYVFPVRSGIPLVENCSNEVDDDDDGLVDGADPDCAVEVADTDLDGVLDSEDNCPTTGNPLQENADTDQWGDACDNCPETANSDTDEDGRADACAGVDEDVQGPSTPTRPGDSCFFTATFQNATGQELCTIRPSCFNTTFTVRDADDNLLPPLYTEGPAVGFPNDVVCIPPGPFSVTCDVCGEKVDPEALIPGTYTVEATYANYLFGDQGLFIGAVTSTTPATLVIAGDPVGETKSAECRFIPAQWSAEWATSNGIPVAVLISQIEGHQVREVDRTTIRINGEVPSIWSWSIDRFGVLIAVIDGAKAIRTLGAVVPGPVFPKVQGAFTVGAERFSAQCPVNIGLVFGLPKGLTFWKQRPDLIAKLISPAQPLLLGLQNISTVGVAQTVLNNAATRNDRLRAQLLATELNLRAGAPKRSCIQPTVNAAQAFLAANGNNNNLADQLKTTLEKYNNRQRPCFLGLLDED